VTSDYVWAVLMFIVALTWYSDCVKAINEFRIGRLAWCAVWLVVSVFCFITNVLDVARVAIK
jgi:hypothetical protein